MSSSAHSSAQPLAARLNFLLAWLLGAGCVVTTHEGPGGPPRIAPAPAPAPASVSDTRAAATGSSPSTTRSNPTETVQASHILVQYRGSVRAHPSIVRSKSEAHSRAEEALARAKQGEDFAKLASEYSDEPGARNRGGSLGRFARSAVVKEFGDAAFALKPGELSEIVETPFGYHVILRTE